jgi:hypothetical protein
MTRKTKVDVAAITQALADVEALIEGIDPEDGIGASTLRLVVDQLGARIKEQHPRFNLGAFEKDALPRQNERLRRAILRAIDGPSTGAQC